MSTVTTALETEVPPLHFEVGLPGFPEARNFLLVNTELAVQPFSIMRCMEDPELEFVVAPPQLFFSDYQPEIDDATANRIGLENSGDALLLVLLTVGEDVAGITANLLGPIIVNLQNNQAAQAILANAPYDTRTPLFSDVDPQSVQQGEKQNS